MDRNRTTFSEYCLFCLLPKEWYPLNEGGSSMFVTATEFKNNFGKYLSIALKEEVIITKNGRASFKLIPYQPQATSEVESLFGILPSDVNEKEILAERAKNL